MCRDQLGPNHVCVIVSHRRDLALTLLNFILRFPYRTTKLGLVDLIHGDFHDLQSVGVRFGGVVFPRSLIGWFSLAAVQGMDGKGPR